MAPAYARYVECSTYPSARHVILEPRVFEDARGFFLRELQREGNERSRHPLEVSFRTTILIPYEM